MKKIVFSIIALCTAVSLQAQIDRQKDINAGIEKAATSAPAEASEPAWTGKGLAGINLSQSSFGEWVAGGDASIAFDLMLNYDLNYKRARTLWTNRLELAYGMNKTETNGLRKTNDKIYFSSNYGYAVVKNLYLGAMLTFNTQFDRGYNYKALSEMTPPQSPDKTNYISKFMAPGYLTAGLGVIWTPKQWLKITYSPASWRGTFVLDEYLSNLGAFGVDPGKKSLTQFGSDLVAEVNTTLWKNLTLYSRLELYSNYLDKPQNLIMHWDTMLSYKIGKWFSTSLNVNMIYDENAIARLQIKQVLGIGLQANF